MQKQMLLQIQALASEMHQISSQVHNVSAAVRGLDEDVRLLKENEVSKFAIARLASLCTSIFVWFINPTMKEEPYNSEGIDSDIDSRMFIE